MDVEGKIEAEVVDKPIEGETELVAAIEADVEDTEEAPRDFDVEARRHGWTPKDEFKGDPAKWVDAETFVKRADEVMPFLKKQNAAIKREFDDFKRQTKKALKFMGEAEQRGYERAMADLQANLDEAVDKGDTAAARKAAKEMGELAKPDVPAIEDDKPDPDALKAEFAQWVEDNDWYVTDANRRLYADTQAAQMGPAPDWPDGPKAWLNELTKRVDRKFAEKKPNPVNGGGNREKPGGNGKGFSDLPAEAKAMCDKWVKSGIIKSREAYVADYDFGDKA